MVDNLDSTRQASKQNFSTKARQWLKAIQLPGNLQFSKLPLHNSPTQRPASQLGVCPILPDTPPGDHKFVLLCVPFMRTLKLHQPEVCKMNSDREFFRVLRYYYASHRETRPWIRLRTVRAINFVKVSHDFESPLMMMILRFYSLRHIEALWSIYNRCHPSRRRAEWGKIISTIQSQQRQTHQSDQIF